MDTRAASSPATMHTDTRWTERSEHTDNAYSLDRASAMMRPEHFHLRSNNSSVVDNWIIVRNVARTLQPANRILIITRAVPSTVI